MRLNRLPLVLLMFYMMCGHSKNLPIDTYGTYNGFIMETLQDSLNWADYYYKTHRYDRAIPLYKKSLQNDTANTNLILRKLALSEASLKNTDASISYIFDYLEEDFNPSFLLHEGFDEIRDTPVFEQLATPLAPKINAWSIIYFVVAFIGFYVIAAILLNKNINRMASWLICAFVFIHSFFILHIAIHRANYVFEYPHSYLMSTWASFLYGPLLYLYFKRITQKYAFKPFDALHLAPTIILLVYFVMNVYSMGADEKIALMLSRLRNGMAPQNSQYILPIVTLKIVSLAAYAFFVGMIYRKAKKEATFDKKSKMWQKSVYHIHVSYVVIYIVYGVVIVSGQSSGLLYNASVAAMSLMVLYVGYSANIQPQVFSGAYVYSNRLFHKYEKSGLTPSLSTELKESLEKIFIDEKIYKENDLNLETLAKRLNTTRHNTSQVINEHFNMSFHELVNKYRIEEAKEILHDDRMKNWNIIDVAYEVGYNNKVTFNKAFKKDTNLTPTEYQRRSYSA